MERFIRIFKKVFFLPPMLVVTVAVFGYTFVTLTAALDIEIAAVRNLSYICSAYAFIITITGFPDFLCFVRRVKQLAGKQPAVKKLLGASVVRRFFNDAGFRTEISLYRGLFISSLYIAMEMFFGIYYRSFWFVSLAVYYILLAVMRLLLLRRGKMEQGKTPMETELYRYRLCGIMLLIMHQALAGIVLLMVRHNRGFNYSGVLIYAVALYAFYLIITAAVNFIKFRNHSSPVVQAAKSINLVAAMVSVLSLETAMLAQFGGDDERFRVMMTGATGCGICTIVISMAVFMIWKSTRQLRNLSMNK